MATCVWFEVNNVVLNAGLLLVTVFLHCSVDKFRLVNKQTSRTENQQCREPSISKPLPRTSQSLTRCHCDYTVLWFIVKMFVFITFDSYPVRNFMSLDLCRTPSLFWFAAALIIWWEKLERPQVKTSVILWNVCPYESKACYGEGLVSFYCCYHDKTVQFLVMTRKVSNFITFRVITRYFSCYYDLFSFLHTKLSCFNNKLLL